MQSSEENACCSLLKRVLSKVKPSEKEFSEEMQFASSLISRIKELEGNHVDAILAGSVARNTHLKGDRDIDIFVLFPKDFSRENFVKEGLRLAKTIFRGHAWEEAYSEHPYIRGKIGDYDVEIVPSYKVDSAAELKSAVDRTPFHNEYLQKKLSVVQRDEVRLFKQFLKGIDCYGAELKHNSVPGYVTELLVLHYGDFLSALKGISEWKRKAVIDLENHHSGKALPESLESHLTIIDPVDRERNVAAALSYNQYARMIAASRAFLEKPSEAFFFGKKEKAMNLACMKKIISEKELIALKLGYPKNALADIVWGQGKRLCRKISAQLSAVGFGIQRSECWTDEHALIVLLFSLETFRLPRLAVKIGPEVFDKENGKRFLDAHKNAISGPRISDGRWVVEVERKFARADSFLESCLIDFRKTEKKPLSVALKKGAKVLTGKEIISLCKNPSFRDFLSSYLKGKESFL